MAKGKKFMHNEELRHGRADIPSLHHLSETGKGRKIKMDLT